MGIKISSVDSKYVYHLTDIDKNICQSQLTILYKDGMNPGTVELMSHVHPEGQIIRDKDIVAITPIKEMTLDEYIMEMDDWAALASAESE